MKINLTNGQKFIILCENSGQPIIIDTIEIDELVKFNQLTYYGTRLDVDWDNTNSQNIIDGVNRVRVVVDYDINNIQEINFKAEE